MQQQPRKGGKVAPFSGAVQSAMTSFFKRSLAEAMEETMERETAATVTGKTKKPRSGGGKKRDCAQAGIGSDSRRKRPSPPGDKEEEEEEEEVPSFFIDRIGSSATVMEEEASEASEEASEEVSEEAANEEAAIEAAAAAMAASWSRPEDGCSAMAHLGPHSWRRAGYALTAAYFAGQEQLRLARHHIESMNHFYHYQVPDTIRMFNAHRVDPETGVEEAPLAHRMVSSQKDKNYDTNDYNLSICYDIGNLRYFSPQMIEPSGEIKPMWPSDARERSRTYAARTKVDIHVTVRHRYDASGENGGDINAFRTEQYTIPDVDFVQMPVLVNSALCLQGVQRAAHVQSVYDAALADARAKGLPAPERVAQRAASAAPLAALDANQDCGGYFIIKGMSKVCIAQEHGTENRINVYPHKGNVWRGWVASIASVPDDRCVSPKSLEMGLLAKSCNLYGHPIHVALPASRMKKGSTISLFLLFRALGVMRDRTICEIILGGPLEQADQDLLADLRASIVDADQILQRSEFQLDGGKAAVAEDAESEEEAEAGGGEASGGGSGDEEEGAATVGKKRKRGGRTEEEKAAAAEARRAAAVAAIREERERRMDDAVLRERAVAYIQSTMSIYDARNRVMPTRGGGIAFAKMPRVDKYTPEEALAHFCYARGDSLAATTAIAPPAPRARGRAAAAPAGGAMDTPLLGGPPPELVEYVQGASVVQRQAVFRHGEARRNVHNEIHKYFRQHNTTLAAPGAPAEGERSWSAFMLGILAVRRAHQQRSRSTDWHRSQTLRVLENDVLPHCKNQNKTVHTLGLMANRLLRVARGELPPSDRDAYTAKRVEPTGVLMNNLFRNLYQRFQKELDRQIKCAIESSGSWTLPRQIFTAENAHQLFNPALIEAGTMSAISTGDFTTKQSRDFSAKRDGGGGGGGGGGTNTKAGIAQVLNRLNYMALVSHVRRLNTPIAGKNGELVAPRQLHGSTYGFLCPVETPEGRTVGLIKQLSLLTVVTVPQLHSAVLYEAAEELASPLEIGRPEGYLGVRLVINGTWVGMARQPDRCVAALRDCKLRAKFSPYTSIVMDHLLGEIRVCTDAGRLCRPLLRVDPATGRVFLEERHLAGLRDGSLRWDDLMLRRDGEMDEPVIEYLDVEEQAFALIVGFDSAAGAAGARAGGPRPAAAAGATAVYCEIHPMTILGAIASTTPFVHCNQSPRNTYQAAMGKQAIGRAPGMDCRTDKTVVNMDFPTNPLVSTEPSRILKCDKWPTGCMVRIAVASYSGYNQEDSIILNRASADRGLFHCTVYKTETDPTRSDVERCNPMADPDKAARTRGLKMHSDYSALGEYGEVAVGTHLTNRQVILGKRRALAPAAAAAGRRPTVTGLPAELATGKYLYEDKSRIVKLSEDAYVDRNTLARDGDGHITARCCYRIPRKMNIGDKVASRQAQKSTNGRMMDPADMPFSADGTTVDIILNPHAFPSRMTVGQLIESNFGKALAELGLIGDCSAFCGITVASVAEELRAAGYASSGTEVFYDGHTGRALVADTFVGPMYYQRLKHMVNDKHHSRTIGPTLPHTRQPTDGRVRDGGLKMGDMERDCVISHGAADLLHERMFDASDAFRVPLCRACGAIAVVNPGDKPVYFAKKGDRVHNCQSCGNCTDFAFVDYPYAMKLYTQELMAMGVHTHIL